MQQPIRGLHHITATVGDAQADLDFCVGTLGLRLVKRTVNFDNHLVHHFYYGNERGEPGTIWTTFPYEAQGVPAGTKGAGQITTTSLSVPADSLGFWRARFTERGVAVQQLEPRFGEESIEFADPSGLNIRLVENDRDERLPWVADDIGGSNAIRGLHSATMVVRSSVKTRQLLTDLLGFLLLDEAEGRTRLAVNGDGPGNLIEIVTNPDAVRAVNGLGTVHHVAMAISDVDQQVRLRQELVRLGLTVTDVRDRCYFRSIYFREPGGVLFEVATVELGFTVDENLACLGESLKLPSWEESKRAMIEMRLPNVTFLQVERSRRVSRSANNQRDFL